MHMRHSRRWACALLALTLALAPAGCAVQQDLTPVLEAGTPADSAAPLATPTATPAATPSAAPLCRALGDARRNPCCDAFCIPVGYPLGIAGG